MLNHPRSDIVGLSLVVKLGLDPVYSFGDIAIFIFCHLDFKLSIHAHFMRFLGHTQDIVIHRSNFQKYHPCAETRRLSHKA